MRLFLPRRLFRPVGRRRSPVELESANMPVVINEFEVVAEPPSSTRSADTSIADETSQSSSPTPREIEQMLRQQLERLARVKAH